MSITATDSVRPEPAPRAVRRVLGAALVGTAIEWYDFFVYAISSGIVFGDLFFSPAGNQMAQIVAFATAGISFLFRPVGAIIAGHLGDKYGRRLVLMLTLVLMGACTTLVGVVPVYARIGLWAPALLVILRILQGISAGGEWGGAALLAVETAPTEKRGLFGTAPQIGVPLGLLTASAVMGLMTLMAPGPAYKAWGWRVPFLLSTILIGVGYYVRRHVAESPVFVELVARRQRSRVPLFELFSRHTLIVIVASLVLAGVQVVGYMTTGGFIQRYVTDPKGPIALPAELVMWAVTGSAVTWIVMTIVGGWASDRFGRRRTLIVGWVLQLIAVFALFPLINTGSAGLLFAALVALTIGLGLTYGPLSALYAELFPTAIRYSGASITFALGAIIGGAFAPAIAQVIMQSTGATIGVTLYLAGVTVVALIATLLLRDRTGIPLDIAHEADEVAPALYGQRIA
jgi:MFS family permease